MEAAVRHRKNKKKRKAIEPTEVQLREEAELEHQLFGGPLQVTLIKIRNISYTSLLEHFLVLVNTGCASG
jgi:hypothetical protein